MIKGLQISDERDKEEEASKRIKTGR